jgi:hypothetical protein
MLDRDQVHAQAVSVATGLREAGGNPVNGGIELSDLDSFTIVETMLTLEDRFGVPLLVEIGEFTGTTFAELADFIVVRCNGNSTDNSGERKRASQSPGRGGSEGPSRPGASCSARLASRGATERDERR